MNAPALRASLLQFRSTHDVPAVGGAIVDQTGHVVVDVVGMRQRGGTDSVDEDDSWHIGSCGKSMIAALYARLVERGPARWGATLAELLPDLASGIHSDWHRVTIDDVLVHRGGIGANLSRAELVAGLRDQRPPRDQRTEVAARALARPPSRRGRFCYSNLGYVVVGAAIERITDGTFEDALTDHLIGPLGITTAGFGPPDKLHLTLADWARFQRVFLAGASTFLSASTVDRLLTPARRSAPEPGDGLGALRVLTGVSVGQQGSNTFWMATALIDDARRRTAMVVCNDGRTRLMAATARLAGELLALPGATIVPLRHERQGATWR